MSKKIIDNLALNTAPKHSDLLTLLQDDSPETLADLTSKADALRRKFYDNKIYIRGLIEFTNFCRNDCYYCGIRKSKKDVSRYRLMPEEILDCCREGYDLGFRTFVLQGGEDLWWNDERLEAVVKSIKAAYPDCAVTLSAGERTRESYQRLFDAGADRYLLRHETANPCHYARLHPAELTLENRMRCLRDLKEIGYQTGCGFMVGSPGQTMEDIVTDLLFLHEFRPEMVGIGPFLPAAGTPFEAKPAGSAELTVKLLSIIRIMLPQALIPATTALGTAREDGREKGILAGANVIMPNLSPIAVRKKYLLYNDKIATGDEAAESVGHLRKSMANIGFEIVTDRGDYINL